MSLLQINKRLPYCLFQYIKYQRVSKVALNIHFNSIQNFQFFTLKSNTKQTSWNDLNGFVNRNYSTQFEQPPSNPPNKQDKLLTKENIYTIPNLITMGRILSTPWLGCWIINQQYEAALGLFVISGFTDVLDGYIARKYKMQSIVGTILDPLADKILMTVLTVSLSINQLIPTSLAFLILGRDGGLVLSSFYYRYISLPPPKTFARYWDFSIPSAEVRPTTISKLNTFLQLALMGSTLLCSVIGGLGHPGLIGLQYIVGATTIGSGLSYVFSKDAVRILKPSAKK